MIFAEYSRAISEINAERQLDISLATANTATLCRHFAKVRAGRVEVHGRGSGDTTAASTPVGMVDEVKCFGTELKSGSFRNRK